MFAPGKFGPCFRTFLIDFPTAPDRMRPILSNPSRLSRFLPKSKIESHRTMSTKPQWLVIVHDYPGTIQKRVAIREQHLTVVSENQAVKAGGNPPSGRPAI